MSRVKQIAIAAGTFSVALGVGFVMQNGDALASRFGNSEPAPADTQALAPELEAAPAVQAGVAGGVPAAETLVAEAPADMPVIDEEQPILAAETGRAAAPELTEPVLEEGDLAAAVALPEAAVPPAPDTVPVELAAAETDDLPEVLTDETPVFTEDCLIDMSGSATDAAFVTIEVDAPCHQNSPFVIHHQGMMFTAMTDDAGKAIIEAPALAEIAVFIAAFPDGEGNVVTTTVPDFAQFDRAVLQWQGDTAVMLSAYEFGADFGEEGHVFRENQQDMDRAINGEGGFLVRLGDMSADQPLMAEVYTAPSGQRDGDIVISAEAEITDGNCGLEVAAQSIQVFPNGETQALDLSLVMPDCDAVGDYLILKNMFEDLTLASR